MTRYGVTVVRTWLRERKEKANCLFGYDIRYDSDQFQRNKLSGIYSKVTKIDDCFWVFVSGSNTFHREHLEKEAGLQQA